MYTITKTAYYEIFMPYNLNCHIPTAMQYLRGGK